LRLFAKISDPELLIRSLNEKGTAFFRTIEGETVEAVYFSSNKAIYFKGELSLQQYGILKAQAYRAKRFKLDENMKIIEVDQLDEQN